jgi:hypothetical protein
MATTDENRMAMVAGALQLAQQSRRECLANAWLASESGLLPGRYRRASVRPEMGGFMIDGAALPTFTCHAAGFSELFPDAVAGSAVVLRRPMVADADYTVARIEPGVPTEYDCRITLEAVTP